MKFFNSSIACQASQIFTLQSAKKAFMDFFTPHACCCRSEADVKNSSMQGKVTDFNIWNGLLTAEEMVQFGQCQAGNTER